MRVWSHNCLGGVGERVVCKGKIQLSFHISLRPLNIKFHFIPTAVYPMLAEIPHLRHFMDYELEHYYGIYLLAPMFNCS